MHLQIDRKQLIEAIKTKLSRTPDYVAAYDVVVEVAEIYKLDIESVAKIIKSDPFLKQAVSKSAIEFKMVTPWSMDAFEAYLLYKGLKLHFNSAQYDWVKYNGLSKNSNKSIASYNKFVKDNTTAQQNLFWELAKHKDPQGLLVSNLVLKNLYIKDIISKAGQITYKDWSSKGSTITYDTSKQLRYLRDKNIGLKESKQIVLCYLSKQISANLASQILSKFGQGVIKDPNPVYEETSLRLIKYTPFSKLNNNTFKACLTQVFVGWLAKYPALEAFL